MPLTLLGLGAVWLIANQRRSRDESWRPPSSRALMARDQTAGYSGSNMRTGASSDMDRSSAGSTRGVTSKVRDRASGAVSDVRRELSRAGDKTSEYVSRAEERAHELAERAGHAVSDSAERARTLAERELNRARELADTNPIALGAAALIAGVGIGLLLPTTRKENELLGPSRDRLLGSAKETVHDIEQAAKDLGQTAKETAREMKNGLSGSMAGHGH